MANVCFGFPILSDDAVGVTPAYSGGSWRAALPLANLKDRRLANVARSTDATTASTTFTVDLGSDVAMRVFALCGHNLSSAATVRVTAVNAAAATVYDSGAITATPSGLNANVAAVIDVPFYIVASANQTARHVTFAITDTTNAAGYVEVGRCIVAAGFQPSVNASYGLAWGAENPTTRTRTVGGAAVYDRQRGARTVAGVLAMMPESEAFGDWFDLKARAGLDGQVFFVYDPDVAVTSATGYKRAMLAVFAQVDPIAHPYFGRYETAFALVEEL